ncbi:MAG TPA: reverse transcriptase domain-containing protein, partial [Chlamydiales bacterium]|nr:reverse transcriptase domain-containing protein [Chlamydiales bacterium]
MKKEKRGRNFLTQKLDDTQLSTHGVHKSVAEMWTAICNEFTTFSLIGVAEKEEKFKALRHKAGASLREELNTVRVEWQNCLNAKCNLTVQDYRNVLLKFGPPALSQYISTVMGQTKAFILATALETEVESGKAMAETQADVTKKLEKHMLSPEAMMKLMLEEWERQEIEKEELNKSRSSRRRDPTIGIAAAIISSERPGSHASGIRGRGRGRARGRGRFFPTRGPLRPVGVCWNCGGSGHKQDSCPNPRNVPQGPSTPGGTSTLINAQASSSTSTATKPPSYQASARTVLDDIAGAWSVRADDWDFSEFILHPPEYGLRRSAVSVIQERYADLDFFSLVESRIGDDHPADVVPQLMIDYDAPNSEPDDTTNATDELPILRKEPCTPPKESPKRDDDDVPPAASIAITVSSQACAYIADDIAINSPVPFDLYDSGASHHMTPHREDFITFQVIVPRPLTAANQGKFHAIGIGDTIIMVPNGTAWTKIRLVGVLYTPDIGSTTLVSIGKIDEAGYISTFAGGKCTIQNADGTIIGVIPKTRGLYMTSRHDEPTAYTVNGTQKLTLMDLHRRMGHIEPKVVKESVEKNTIIGIQLTSNEITECDACVQGKLKRLEVAKERMTSLATKFGEHIHSDVWGPTEKETLGGKKYFVSYTDDHTRWTTVYLLRQKSEVFATFKAYHKWVNTHLKVPILRLHSDRGGEYTSAAFQDYLHEQGIEMELTVHDTPEHNGVAERLNGVLLEKVRTMLIAAQLPVFLWAEALTHAVYLKNRTSTRILEGKTPFELVMEEPPNLSDLPEWGMKAWVHDTSSGKLSVRAQPGFWVGFDIGSNGHRIYWADKRSITAERSIRFTKPVVTFIDQGEDSDAASEGEENVDGRAEGDEEGRAEVDESAAAPEFDDLPDNLPQVAPDLHTQTGRPKRDRKPSRYIRDLESGLNQANIPKGMQVPKRTGEAMAVLEEEIHGVALAAAMAEADAYEPKDLPDAKRRPEWPLWYEAMKTEIKALEDYGTWKVVKTPPNVNIIGCRWVYAVKKDANGNVVRRRARLVAQGFSQVEGVDFFDTYAPVAKTASIRTVLAFAAKHNLEIHQVDVKSAYLNGKFEDEEVIYMRLPPGIDITQEKGVALLLVKPIYGLRQAARRWYNRLLGIVDDELEMEQCSVDQAVFFRIDTQKSGLIVILTHVDDLTIVTTTLELMEEVKMGIRRQVEISDGGEVHWILGIAVERDRDARTLALSQTSYLRTILERYGFADVKPAAIPMEPNAYLSTSQGPKTDTEFAEMINKPYREAVGALMYAVMGTQLDIAYAVGILARFNQSPGLAHWKALKKVYAYLAGTLDYKLTYGGNDLDLVGYSDADGSMHEERKAISGYALLLNGTAVSWKSQKQEIIVLSTTEAEYAAATQATKEALWLRS